MIIFALAQGLATCINSTEMMMCFALAQGLATCINSKEIPALQQALDAPQAALKTPHAGILPEWDQMERFAGQLPGETFPSVLKRFGGEARIDGTFFFCKQASLSHAVHIAQVSGA